MREKNEFEPEFRRVALRRTPSHEQLADEESIKTSMRKTGVISSNLKKTGSFTSLTAINRSISRSGSPAPGEYNEPEFKGVSLKKVDNSPSRPAWSRSGSRAGSPDKKETEFKRVGLKQTAGSSKTGSRRGSATEETEMASINLKKTQRVQSDQSKFELEHVDLKGFKNGEVGEDSVQNQINQTIKQSKASNLEKKKFEKMEKKKFESGDDEFESISDSLTKLKKGGSRAGSPDQEDPEFMKVSMKQTPNSSNHHSGASSRRGSTAEETEISQMNLKRTSRVKSDHSKLELEHVNLTGFSKAKAGNETVEIPREDNDLETHSDSLQKLKKTSRVQSDHSKFELEHVNLTGFSKAKAGSETVKIPSEDNDLETHSDALQKLKKTSRVKSDHSKFELDEVNLTGFSKAKAGNETVEVPRNDDLETHSDSLQKFKETSRVKSDQSKLELEHVNLTTFSKAKVGNETVEIPRDDNDLETHSDALQKLKKTSRVQSDHSKFELEHVNLTGFSKAKAGNETVEIPREDNELETHSDSLQKLKKKTEHVEEESEIAKDASPVNGDPESESKKNEKPPVLPPVFTAPFEDHPVFYRRKPRRSETDEQKRKSFILDGEASGPARPSNLRRQSFTSSLENIHVADQQQHEKVHLSVFTKEMGSNVDLVQVCEKTEEKQEAKLEFSDLTSISLFPSTNATQSTEQIENGLQKARSSTKINAKVDSLRSSAKTSRDESPVKELLDAKAALRKAKLSKSKQSNLELEEVHLKPVLRENESEENLESTEEILNAAKCILQSYKTKEGAEQTQVESDSGVEEESATSESESEAKSGKLHKLRKAPSIDGLFQTQDTHAAFTFKLPS